ncbi:non-specific lipid-transfer protein AP10-like protein [Tanacetum coccineum]
MIKRSMSVAMLAMITWTFYSWLRTNTVNADEGRIVFVSAAGMLSPYLNYLKSGGSPGASCCAGAKRVQGATRSQADRRAACKCTKAGASQYGFNRNNAASLPSKCGIRTTIPVDPSVNCDTSNMLFNVAALHKVLVMIESLEMNKGNELRRSVVLSTLHFLKITENSFEVLKLLENSVEVLKILENKLELMKILENKLEALKL